MARMARDQRSDRQRALKNGATGARSNRSQAVSDSAEEDFFRQGHQPAPYESPRAEEKSRKTRGAGVQATVEGERTSEAMEPLKPVATFAQDPELLVDFVMESGEHLMVIEEHMLLLERDPNSEESIHTVFRSFHTIKGLSGFLELHGVRQVAHEIETLLDRIRNKKLTVTPKIVDLILASADYLKDEVAAVRAAIDGLHAGPIRDGEPIRTEVGRILAAAELNDLEAPIRAGGRFDRSTIERGDVKGGPSMETLGAIRDAGGGSEVEAAGLSPETPTSEIPTSGTPTAWVCSTEATERETTSTDRRKGEKGSIRLETAKLDQLMDMVGEMVIAQTILSHNPAVKAARDARLDGDLAQLTRITGEVQRCAMIMRMTPISGLFQKTARMVRDLARRAAKNVSFEMVGEQTELDKTIAEELSDPLLHMVRNALDHGIERPEERIARGKNPEARLKLIAKHEAGQIMVGISDDGRGLNSEKIMRKAADRGLVKADTNLSEKEIYQLIFEPGFSTAETVTDISGRGVGMDVVKKHVEKLRGRIEITSQMNQGTTFSLYLPLTLAVIEGLVIFVGVERYIIPIFSIHELMRPTPEILFTVAGKGEMVVVRGELLPMVRLYHRLGIVPKSNNPCDGLLIVAESGTKRFALLVDGLVGRQEVVIKSLSDTFKHNSSLAGCAVLGDGRVGIILDMAGLYHSRRDAA